MPNQKPYLPSPDVSRVRLMLSRLRLVDVRLDRRRINVSLGCSRSAAIYKPLSV